MTLPASTVIISGIEDVPSSFEDVNLVTQTIDNDPTACEVPDPVTWASTSPVVDVDFSCFCVATEFDTEPRFATCGVTKISAHWAIGAHHCLGNKWYFKRKNNAAEHYVGRTGAVVQVGTLADDIGLVKLDADTPGVGIARFINNTAPFLNKWCTTVMINRHTTRMQLVERFSDNSANWRRVGGTSILGLSNPNTGMSSHPMFTLIDNVPVLLTCASGATGSSATPGNPDSIYVITGRQYSEYLDEIEAVLAADGEHITYYSVAGGTDRAPAGATVLTPSTSTLSSPLNSY